MKKFVLLVVALSFLLVSCNKPIEGYSGHYYKIIKIEGMPCLVVDGGITIRGISCDWSKWEGNSGG